MLLLNLYNDFALPPSKIYHEAFKPIVLEKLEDSLLIFGEVLFNSPLLDVAVNVFTILNFGCPAASAESVSYTHLTLPTTPYV